MTGVEEAALIAAVAPEVIGGAEVAGMGAGAAGAGGMLGAGLPAAGALGGLDVAAPEVAGFGAAGAPITAGDMATAPGWAQMGAGPEAGFQPFGDITSGDATFAGSPTPWMGESMSPIQGGTLPSSGNSWLDSLKPDNLFSTQNLQKGVLMGLLGQMGGSLFKGNQPNVRPPPQASIPQITHRPREVQPTALHQLAYLQAQQNMRRNKPGMFG